MLRMLIYCRPYLDNLKVTGWSKELQLENAFKLGSSQGNVFPFCILLFVLIKYLSIMSRRKGKREIKNREDMIL